MIEDDVIEETKSAWSSPILLVPKKSISGEKKFRLVIDYRKLNEKIVDDRFPLPNILDILDALSGSVYFTHLDLFSGYYQVKLEEESRKCTAFTFDKQYQMKRMPMGLKISPSAFSRVMTVALSGLNYDKCLVYLDDLIVFGRNLALHNKNLIDVFYRLREVNLRLNPQKCEFLKKEIVYLGHVVTPEGVKPDPGKVKALTNYPVPKSIDEVKRFVAFSNYYRRFIPHFGEIVIPLNKLCKKYATFIWDNSCQKAFEKLRESLSTPPVLQFPDFSQENEFQLHTDASGTAIGSVLSNKNKLPIAYASRGLNKAELNYPTVEKELLSIVWSVNYFRHYLLGKKFRIFTDHRPLVYLFNMNNPSSRLIKFRLKLEEYDFEIEYVKGKDNVAADALSRVLLTSDELKRRNEHVVSIMTRRQKRDQEEEQKEQNLKDTNISADGRCAQPDIVEMFSKPKNTVELVFTTHDKMKRVKGDESSELFIYDSKKYTIYTCPQSRSCITRDVYVREFEQFCENIDIKEIYIMKGENNDKYIKWLANDYSKYKNNNKRKRSGPRIYIIKEKQRITSNEDKLVVLNDFHILPTAGHAGIRRMINNIRKYYTWPKIEKDVKEYVSKCAKCQTQKHSIPIKEPMVVTTTATSAFDKIYLDIVGPLVKDYFNKTYILTIQCELTKFVEAYALDSKDATTVANAFVEGFVLRYGIPKEIATDRGTEFLNTVLKEVCRLLGISQLTSTAYHHETIGSLENSHKNLNSFLRIQTNNELKIWSTWVPYWCFSYNTTVHTSTKFTPYELVFGKICNIPSNLVKQVEPLYNCENYPLLVKYRIQKAQDQARQNLIQSKIVRTEKANQTSKSVTYKPNDYILVKNESGNKFQNVYNGPYIVLEDMSPNVRIIKDGKIDIVHKNRTKLFVK